MREGDERVLKAVEQAQREIKSAQAEQRKC